MKKNFTHLMLLWAVVLLAFTTTSCKEDEETISDYIVGEWKVENDQIKYDEGLLAGWIGGASGIDQGMANTVLETVSAMFKNSTMTFESNGNGVLSKGLSNQGSSSGNGILGDLLGGLTNNLLSTNFTYKTFDGGLTLDLAGKTYQVNVVSITKTEMKLSLKVADVTKLSSILLKKGEGDSEMQKRISKICDTLDSYTGKFNLISLNPRITMVFLKK